MSISTNKPEADDEKFDDIVFSDRPHQTAAPSEPQKEAEATAPAPVEKAPELKADSKKAGYVMDIVLIVFFVHLLGVGWYFIKTQMSRYEVPTPYEEACAEYERLNAEFNTIISNKKQVNNIRKVKELQRRISTLEAQIAEAEAGLQKAKEKKASIVSSIAQEKQAIDSARYNLRETDRDFRAKAMAELPGLPVGNIINRRRNSVFNDAVIAAVDMHARRIKFRSHSGQVNWEIKAISKKELPPIVRYALNLADLVDMSVLDEEGKTETKRRPIARREEMQSATAADDDTQFDPEQTGPIISSGQSETLSSDPSTPHETSTDDVPTWDAPTGDLPI